jgi:hypothetical protein
MAVAGADISPEQEGLAQKAADGFPGGKIEAA